MLSGTLQWRGSPSSWVLVAAPDSSARAVSSASSDPALRLRRTKNPAIVAERKIRINLRGHISPSLSPSLSLSRLQLPRLEEMEKAWKGEEGKVW